MLRPSSQASTIWNEPWTTPHDLVFDMPLMCRFVALSTAVAVAFVGNLVAAHRRGGLEIDYP